MQLPLTRTVGWQCDVLKVSIVREIKEKDKRSIIISLDPRNNSEGLIYFIWNLIAPWTKLERWPRVLLQQFLRRTRLDQV